MNSIKSKVQLMGNVENDPEIIVMENGNKLARCSLAIAQQDSKPNKKKSY